MSALVGRWGWDGNAAEPPWPSADLAIFLNSQIDPEDSLSLPEESIATIEPTRPGTTPERMVEPSTGHSAVSTVDASTQWWWQSHVHDYLLDTPDMIQVDIPTLLTNTLQSSPRISAISRRTSIAYEQIIQQQAVFDPAMLLDTGYGRVNDPVGSTLTTGGPPRLIQDSFSATAGIQKLTQLGTQIDLSQEIGTLQSNSVFFDPAHQGNSRLSLSITQPLMATSGRVYNLRLVTQASIDSRIAWQQLRVDLENHLIETLSAFWRLYERRAQLVQQRALIQRGKLLAQMVTARADFDSGPLQQVKITRRLASDRDRLLELEAEVNRLQVRLKTLVGDPALTVTNDALELIPLADPSLPSESFHVRDCVVRGLEHRADILAATQQLSAAGLEVSITSNELMPRLNAVIDAYLAGLNGSNNIGQSLVDQYSEGGPGITAALTYNLPWGRRAAKSRHREACYRYQQRSEELRETLLVARREIESALIKLKASEALRESRAATLSASAREEAIATRRWETLAGDGGPMALVLEDLLETQKRRTDAEQSYVSAQINYVLDLVALQQAMGTFLIREGIEPVRGSSTSMVEVIQTAPIREDNYPMEVWVNERSERMPISSPAPFNPASDQSPLGIRPSLGIASESGLLEFEPAADLNEGE
ncbi:TolC family protein [Neorhodopirellula pilleata]|nr:TolC family protein [Neorhodopirellula pilleata]